MIILCLRFLTFGTKLIQIFKLPTVQKKYSLLTILINRNRRAEQAWTLGYSKEINLPKPVIRQRESFEPQHVSSNIIFGKSCHERKYLLLSWGYAKSVSLFSFLWQVLLTSIKVQFKEARARKRDCLPVFTVERTEPQFKPGIYIWIISAL